MDKLDFRLRLRSGVKFSLSGMEAVNFLAPYGIKGNDFSKERDLYFHFSLEEVNASKLLQLIFKSNKVKTLYCKGGEFNDCADIVELYDDDFHDSAELNENAKEVLFNIFNKKIKEGVTEIKTENADTIFSIHGGVLRLIDEFKYTYMDIVNSFFKAKGEKKYKDWYDKTEYAYSTEEEKDIKKLIQDINVELSKYITDVSKMKNIWNKEKDEEEKKEKERQEILKYNSYLLSLWKDGKILTEIDVEKDNLKDILSFIQSKAGGNFPDFDWDEGSIKAFACDGKMQMYNDGFDNFTMDVNSSLPKCTWRQFTGLEEILPINSMLKAFKKSKIGITITSKEEFYLITTWINTDAEYNDKDAEVNLVNMHNWNTTMYIDKDGKITLGCEETLKKYTVNQFMGLEHLNLYCSELKNFNGHKWIKFYEDIEGHPNVEWKEGCHNIGLESFMSFEQRVEDKYGDEKESLVYRTYMLESDKLRLALNLPPRTVGVGETIIKVLSFKNLLEERTTQINDWITSTACNSKDYYIPKNMMWLLQSKVAKNSDFHYLSSDGEYDGDQFYYDLITINYLKQDFAIPVPLLSKIIGICEKDIYDCFEEIISIEEDFI